MNKHLLLISYVFPPYPGIGGRRWAKMAKYLARDGYTVHVLTAANPFDAESLWSADVKHEHIHVYELPPCYPSVLLKTKFSLLDKLSYRWWLWVLRRRHRGSIYDRALDWQVVMTEKACTLIRDYQIGNVIASGAPFRSLYYATELKKEFPTLHVITDFRDPWTTSKSYGFSDMEDLDMAVEVALEKKVVEGADLILSPAQEIINDLKGRYGHSEKYVHLEHAFDPDDFTEANATPLFQADIISFAFTGTIYAGLEGGLRELVAMLEKLKGQFPETYRKVRIDFYTADNRHSALFASVGDVVRFLKPLPPHKLYASLRHYRFALVMFTEQYKHFLSTKFRELFYVRLPVVYVGPAGYVSEFLKNNSLGIALTGADPFGELSGKLVKGFDDYYNQDFDVTENSCAQIVKQLQTCLR